MKIKYKDISDAVSKGYFQIERQHINGWVQDEITDNVCYKLIEAGVEITDIPANCMLDK